MKTLLSVLLVAVLGWLGATYYIGMQVEQLVRENVAGSEILPGQQDLVLDVLRYDRGLFSSRAVTCLIIQGELASQKELGAMSGKLCSRSTIHHGPLAWGSDGLYLGLASSEEALDLSELPPPAKAMVDEVFKGKAPITGISRYGFDGSIQATVAISPVNLESPMGQVTLQQFQVDVLRPALNAYPVKSFLTVKGLDVVSPQGGFKVPSLTGAIDVVAMLAGELPITEVNLTGEGLSFSRGDMPMLGFDLVLQSNSTMQGNSLSGTSGLWLEKVSGAMLPVPMDSAYLGVNFAELDSPALAKLHGLSNELDQLQTGMMLGALGGGTDGLDAQMQRITAIMGEMAQLASEKLLHPGKSAVGLQLLVDYGQQRMLTVDSKARYLGKDGKNLTVEEFQALNQDQYSELLDLSVRVDMDESLLLPPFAEQMQAMAEQGLVFHDSGRWQGRVRTSPTGLEVNGLPMTSEELNQRLALARGSEQGTHSMDEEGDPVAVMPVE